MSTLRVDTLQTKAGQEVYTAKAWVNFNGTGTVAIRGSGNVSSITDIGTGAYTVNFTNAMIDANYCLCGSAGTNENAVAVPTAIRQGLLTTTGAGFTVTYASAGTTAAYDYTYVSIVIFR